MEAGFTPAGTRRNFTNRLRTWLVEEGVPRGRTTVLTRALHRSNSRFEALT
jgi:hypothetical protein